MGKNSDVIKQAYAAFARQDIPGVLAVFDPDIAWYTPDSVSYGGTFKGTAEVTEFFMSLPETYSEITVTPELFVEDGDTVVALGMHNSKGKSGKSFDEQFVHVWTFRDGKATTFTEFFDTAKLNAALA